MLLLSYLLFPSTDWNSSLKCMFLQLSSTDYMDTFIHQKFWIQIYIQKLMNTYNKY